MKKIYLLTVLALVCQVTVAQVADFLAHGPYLMNPAMKEVAVLFKTQQRSLSWVEVKEAGSEQIRQYRSHKHGLYDAFNLYNTVLLDSLKENTGYLYRIASQNFRVFEPYKKEKEEPRYTGWYSFRTLPDKADDVRFCVLNDIHDNTLLMETLLNRIPCKENDFVVMNGDMSNLIEKEEQPYIVLDKATEMFARQIPILYVRGNHETRGKYARVLHHYADCSSGRYYRFFRFADCAVIVLDSGDEGGDDTPAYAGTTAFDIYRSEQTRWLEEVVKSPEYLNARYRVVFTHIPPIGANSRCRAVLQTQEEWVPILNRSEIDLMVCGHNHHFGFTPVSAGRNEFPVVVNGKNTIMEISVSSVRGLDYRVINENGEVILTKK